MKMQQLSRAAVAPPFSKGQDSVRFDGLPDLSSILGRSSRARGYKTCIHFVLWPVIYPIPLSM